MSTITASLPADLSANLRSRLEVLFDKLEGINPNDQAYERTIRETLVMGDPLEPQEAQELLDATIAMCHRSDSPAQLLLPCFYGAFEWFNRREKDAPTRNAKWDALMHAVNKRFEGYSLYHYVASRYHLAKGRMDDALVNASAAVDVAPAHGGFLNNYGELVLDVVESRLLSGDHEVLERENSRGEDLERIIQRFDGVIAGKGTVYPSFHLTRGRLNACLQRFDAAERDFNAARALIVKMHDEGHPRFSNEGDFIVEIGKVINAQSTASVLKSSYTAWDSLNAARAEQDAKAAALQEKIDEVFQRLDDERVNLLEFLGFFSGIISFIIASIQVGSDMDFAARAALLIVMLGTLLIAFGALGYLIESSRSGSAEAKGVKRVTSTVGAKSRVLLIVGIGTVLFGVVLYFLLRLVA